MSHANSVAVPQNQRDSFCAKKEKDYESPNFPLM